MKRKLIGSIAITLLANILTLFIVNENINPLYYEVDYFLVFALHFGFNYLSVLAFSIKDRTVERKVYSLNSVINVLALLISLFLAPDVQRLITISFLMILILQLISYWLNGVSIRKTGELCRPGFFLAEFWIVDDLRWYALLFNLMSNLYFILGILAYHFFSSV